MHRFPDLPHAASDRPGRQVVPSQHPVQLLALHRALELELQRPLVQSMPVQQLNCSLQGLPFLTQPPSQRLFTHCLEQHS